MFDALKLVAVDPDATKAEIDLQFKKANAEVAKVLNHTRSVNQKQKDSIQKDLDKITELKKDIKKLNNEGKSTVSKEKQIKNRELAIEKKKDVMAVAVNTSLTNYIDPRIIVAWTKTFEIDPSYIYSKTLLTKFQWAIQTTRPKWNWETAPIQMIGDVLEPSKEEGTAVDISKKTSPKSRRDSKKTPAKLPPKLPPKKAPKLPPKKHFLNSGGGTLEDFKKLFYLCENPHSITILEKVSKDALDWIYPFCNYALTTVKGKNKLINHIIVSFYKIHYLAKNSKSVGQKRPRKFKSKWG